MKNKILKKKRKPEATNNVSLDPNTQAGQKKSSLRDRLNKRRQNIDSGGFDSLDDNQANLNMDAGDLTNPFANDHATTNSVEDVFQPPQSGDSLNISQSTNTTYTNNDWYKMSGRIGRVQYLAYTTLWWFVLAIILYIALFLSFDSIASMLSGSSSSGSAGLGIVALLLFVVMFLISMYSSFTLAYRRIQDMGKPAVWLIGLFIPIIQFILSLLILFKKGDEGSNQYGAPPAPYSKLELILAILSPIIFLLVFVAPFVLITGAVSQMDGVQRIDADAPAMIDDVQVDIDTINSDPDINAMTDDKVNDVDINDLNLDDVDVAISADSDGIRENNQTVDGNTDANVDAGNTDTNATPDNNAMPDKTTPDTDVKPGNTDTNSASPKADTSAQLNTDTNSQASQPTPDTAIGNAKIKTNTPNHATSKENTKQQLQVPSPKTGDKDADASLDQINSTIGKDSPKSKPANEMTLEEFMNEAELTIGSE